MSRLSREQLTERLRRMRLLALDVDGVLTDDSLYFGPDGFELKKFNISDGLFIVLAMRQGLEIAIVSGRYSPATDSRMKDLGITHVLQGSSNKVAMIEPLLAQLKVSFEETGFVGNEILDLGLARKVGLSVAVADSCPELLAEADYVLSRKGGEGAVRELLELYFASIGVDPKEYLR